MRPTLTPDRLAVHTMTTKPWSLRQACEAYAAAGVGGISPWAEHVEPLGVAESARIITESGLAVPAYVRGGFFVAAEAAERQAAIDRTRVLLDDAATLGAGMLVIVPGAQPGVPLGSGRGFVAEALGALADHAQALGVRLAVEPLHPMYAPDRSCVNSVASARGLCDRVDHPALGVAIDVYHVWWEPGLYEQIATLGRESRLLALHVCDFKVETAHLLLDRGLMGEGVIDIRGIRAAAESAGFAGLIEVEIFSEKYWGWDQGQFLDRIIEAAAASA